MKKPFLHGLLCLGLLAFLPAWAAEKLTLAYSDVESELYQLGNGPQVANPPGAAVELINQVAKELNLQVSYVRLPVKRIFEAMAAGEVDGSFMFSFKDERLAYGHYPMKDGKPNSAQRITTLTYSFYKQKGSAFNWDGKAASGMGANAIGVNSNYSVGPDLVKLGLRVEEAKTTEQNFQKLESGRIAAYAMQDHTADMFIAEHKLANVEKVATPFSSKDYFLMLSKGYVQKNAAQAEKLWAKVAELREAKLKEMLRKYM